MGISAWNSALRSSVRALYLHVAMYHRALRRGFPLPCFTTAKIYLIRIAITILEHLFLPIKNRTALHLPDFQIVVGFFPLGISAVL